MNRMQVGFLLLERAGVGLPLPVHIGTTPPAEPKNLPVNSTQFASLEIGDNLKR
jgi:hypothetical protein